MKAFTFATVAALASTSLAATVSISETPCLQNTTLSTFDVEIGSLYVQDFPSVCGFKINSADGADVASVKCQAYKDAEGTEKGSAEFTADKPALIATNPVQEGSILCVTDALPSGGATTFSKITAAPTATGGASPTSGNGTAPGNTASPTQPTNPSGSGSPSGVPGTANTIGMSFGALSAAALAMLFL